MKIKALDNYGYRFYCPGCKEMHQVPVAPHSSNGSSWTFNGNEEQPTFSPSLLIRSGHYMQSHKQGDSCWCTYNAAHPDNPSHFKCGVCHSFITDGKIQYLSDCTHELAGQTIELPELPY